MYIIDAHKYLKHSQVYLGGRNILRYQSSNHPIKGKWRGDKFRGENGYLYIVRDGHVYRSKEKDTLEERGRRYYSRYAVPKKPFACRTEELLYQIFGDLRDSINYVVTQIVKFADEDAMLRAYLGDDIWTKKKGEKDDVSM